MNHDDLIAKLQKLLALAQRGEGGEAVNARELLDKMMAKYGIDEASLTDIRTLRCATDSDAEKELLIVVISFALQIPTVQVEADIIVRTEDVYKRQGPEEVGVAAVGPVRVVTDQSRLGVAFFNSGNMSSQEVVVGDDDFSGFHSPRQIGC